MNNNKTLNSFALCLGFAGAFFGLFVSGPLDLIRFAIVYLDFPHQYLLGVLFVMIPLIGWSSLAWLLLQGEKEGHNQLGRPFLKGVLSLYALVAFCCFPSIVGTAVVDSGGYWVSLWVGQSGILGSSLALGFMLSQRSLSKWIAVKFG